MRQPQSPHGRGSLKWMQLAANERADYLNRMVRDACSIPLEEMIEWLSPRADDEWAEYRDRDFLNLLGIELSARPLREFWPRLGPQWDALGRIHSGRGPACGSQGEHTGGSVSTEPSISAFSIQNQG